MENVTMIAAIGKNRELGKKKDLIWHIKEDMQYFKDKTIGKPVIMGRNTFLSLDKPLKDRKNIVVTTRVLEVDSEVKIIRNIPDLLNFIKDYQEEVMIIGGAQLYSSMLKYANKLLLTEIEAEDKLANVYFPRFNKEDYYIEGQEKIYYDEENNLEYKHLIYTKKR